MATSALKIIFCTILGPHKYGALNQRFASSVNLAQTCKAGRQRFKTVKAGLCDPCTQDVAKLAESQATSQVHGSCYPARENHLPRPHKLRLAAEVRDLLHNNEMVAVLSYYNMKNIEWNELIYEVGKSNINFRFLPNKIVHRALDSTAYVNMCPLFISTTVVAYSQDVQIKQLMDALKSQRKVQLLGGKVNDRLFGTEKFNWVSKLPPIEQLHLQISMSLSQPAQNIGQLLMRNQQVLSQNLGMITRGEDV